MQRNADPSMIGRKPISTFKISGKATAKVRKIVYWYGVFSNYCTAEAHIRNAPKPMLV